MKKIKAEIWSIRITEGALDFAHGFSHALKEIYIPSKNISVNLGLDGKTLYCFESYDGRYNHAGDVKVKDIEIEAKDVKAIEKFIETKDALSKEMYQFLK